MLAFPAQEKLKMEQFGLTIYRKTIALSLASGVGLVSASELANC